MGIKEEAKGWARELAEVAITLAIILIISRLFFGPHMLVPLVAVTSNSMLHVNEEWNSWLVNHGISEDEIEKFPLKGGFAMGDMIITISPNRERTIIPLYHDTSLGDVVIYSRDRLHPGNEPIIHRIVGIVRIEDYSIAKVEGTLDCLSERDFELKFIPKLRECVNEENCPYTQFPETGSFKFYITKGDNNRGSDQCGSNEIALPVTEGQLQARGWIKLPYIGWLKLALNSILRLGNLSKS